MQKTALVFCFLFSISFSFTGWVIESVDTNWSYIQNTSIAIDSYDRPHIAYKGGFNLKYAYYDGSQWLIYTIDTISPGDCSLALDSDNNPHIAYNNLSNLTLKYAYYDGSSWQITDVDTDYNVGDYNSIDIDSNNNPHISYYDDRYYDLKYAYFDGDSWQISNIDASILSGSHTSLKLDNNDLPHISYKVVSSLDLKYTYYNGIDWIISGIDSGGDVGSHSSLDLDINENPGIAYSDSTNTALKYAIFDGSVWNITTIDSEGSVGSFSSLAFNSYDNPHISYYDGTNLDLKYAYNDGTDWQISTLDSDGQVGTGSSIAVDSNDNPHISYVQNYPMPYALKYAHYVNDTGVSLLSFAAQPQPNSAIKLVWQVSASDDSQIVGFNLYRADAGKERKKDWARLNSSPITGKNPYQFADSSVKAGQGYYYRLSALTADGKEEMLGTTQGEAGTTPAQFALTTVYPNPTNSLLTCCLTMPQSGSVSLGLYDISGRLVLSKRMDLASGEQDTTLEVGNLAKGVYTVQVESGGTVQSKRIVVMR
jgi:hypothetical protein